MELLTVPQLESTIKRYFKHEEKVRDYHQGRLSREKTYKSVVTDLRNARETAISSLELLKHTDDTKLAQASAMIADTYDKELLAVKNNYTHTEVDLLTSIQDIHRGEAFLNHLEGKHSTCVRFGVYIHDQIQQLLSSGSRLFIVSDNTNHEPLEIIKTEVYEWLLGHPEDYTDHNYTHGNSLFLPNVITVKGFTSSTEAKYGGMYPLQLLCAEWGCWEDSYSLYDLNPIR